MFMKQPERCLRCGQILGYDTPGDCTEAKCGRPKLAQAIREEQIRRALKNARYVRSDRIATWIVWGTIIVGIVTLIIMESK